MTKSNLARKYRNEHPDANNKKLARIMYNDNKLTFRDVEDARRMLRYIEGKSGERDRKKVRNTPFVSSEPRPHNPYKLPPSDETSFEPYILKGHKRVALFSDIHVPYHSIEALTAAIEYTKKQKPDALVINGDGLDFHSLSRFCKDPKKKDFATELSTWSQLIEVFERELKCKIYYKLGNHEERYEHFLWMKAGEIAGLDEFKIENILKARARGIEVITDKRIIKAGGLNIIHGHEFGSSVFSPVNIARGLFNKGKANAIQGHNHQVSEHTEPDMNGSIITTWSQGCLCELHPEYLPINKWAHGFAIVDLDGEDFQVTNKRIYKGKVL